MVQRSFSSPHKAISEAAHDSCSQIADVWELGAVHPQHDVLFSGCLFSIVFRVLVSKEASAFHKKENSKIWEKLDGKYTIQQRLKKFYNRLEQKFELCLNSSFIFLGCRESSLQMDAILYRENKSLYDGSTRLTVALIWSCEEVISDLILFLLGLKSRCQRILGSTCYCVNKVNESDHWAEVPTCSLEAEQPAMDSFNIFV